MLSADSQAVKFFLSLTNATELEKSAQKNLIFVLTLVADSEKAHYSLCYSLARFAEFALSHLPGAKNLLTRDER